MNFNFLYDVNILINFLIFIASAAILIKGSDIFIESAVNIASKFKISKIIIGLTLVSFGTSLPELAANISSAFNNRSAIALGNITGSNISNTFLILGVALILVNQIKCTKQTINRDVPVMLGISAALFVFVFFFDKNAFMINKFESVIMLIMLIFYFFYLIKYHKDDVSSELEEITDTTEEMSNIKIFIYLIAGLAFIYIGSEFMIQDIIVISYKLKISDGIIGATLVAIATSTPELLVTIIGVLKKNTEIGLSNVIGSNIINILGILGVTGMIDSIKVIDYTTNKTDYKLLFYTLPVMILSAVLLFVFMKFNKKLTKTHGIIFLILYILFLVFSYIK